MEIDRRNLLRLAALATASAACGPGQTDARYSLISETTSHGVHLLFLERGDTDPSVGAYVSVLRRESITTRPNYGHTFEAPNFHILLRLRYIGSTNNLNVGVGLLKPRGPKAQDAFVTDIRLSADPLSFLIVTWKNFKFNPSFIYNSQNIIIERSNPVLPNSLGA